MNIQTLAKLQLAPLFPLVICCITVGAHAQGVIIDQSLQPPAIIPGKSYSYNFVGSSLVAPFGQEFTPSLNGLDFVDVNFLNQVGTNGGAGTFQIAIHQGTITAPVLGVSRQMTFSSGEYGTDTRFAFSSTVPLAPGNLYVLEILQLAGNSTWGVEVPVSAVVDGQTINMNYPGGRLIFGGVPRATQDMIFQEGIFVPEPSVSFLLLPGVLVFGLARKACSKWQPAHGENQRSTDNSGDKIVLPRVDCLCR